MNTFKKAACLGLLLANCAVYAGENENNTNSWAQWTKDKALNVPAMVWNHKRSLAEVAGFFALAYFGNKVKNAQFISKLNLLDKVDVLQASLDSHSSWSAVEHTVNFKAIPTEEIAKLIYNLEPSSESYALTQYIYKAAKLVATKIR